METKDLDNISDDILLARIQNGDDEVLVDLIKKYERLLKTIIHREIRNPEEEPDIYQETILAIVRRILRQSDDIASIEKWLKQIARSKCKAFLVNAKKRGIIREYAEEHYLFAAEKEKRPDYLYERVSEILEVVEGMDPIYVEVVELWAQGFTERESASVLNISVNTVKSRRNKIREVVRGRLGVSRP